MIQNIDLTAQTNTQLDNLIRNRSRHGDLVGARDAAIERIGRGRYKPHHLTYLSWTPTKIAALLVSFAELSDAVVNNRRKPGVLCGGRCRRGIHDSTSLWVDRYVGVTTSSVNAAIACHIRAPGDAPVFVLQIKLGEIDTSKQYSINRLNELLKIWEKLCRIAERSISVH